MSTLRGWGRGLIVVVSAAVAGCFGGYDSRWGDDRKLQAQRAAQGRTLDATERVATSSDPNGAADAGVQAPPVSKEAMRKLYVRAYVTRSFTLAVSETPRYIRELLEDASDVLEPALGARLELEGIRQWNLANDDDLHKVLADLRKEDSGKEVGWVVGFVGSLSRLTISFHDAGMAELPGRHIVVRAPSSADIHENIEQRYDELSSEERQALRKGIKRHRAAALFLHEVGHTLAVPHERSHDSVMYPAYSGRSRGFAPESSALMKIALDGRNVTAADDAARFYRAAADALAKAPAGVYVEDERRRYQASFDELAQKNDAIATNARSTETARQVAPKPAIPDTPELSPSDRATFEQAFALSAAGNHAQAWTLAKPLYAAYPRSLAVQDFRCRIATYVMAFASARPECDALMSLSK